MSKSDRGPVPVRRLLQTDRVTADALVRAYKRQAIEIESILSPLRQSMFAIDVAMKSHRPLTHAMEESSTPLQRHVEAFNATLEPLARQWIDCHGQLDALAQQSQGFFSTIERWAQKQPQRDQRTAMSLDRLATFGWYCDPAMPTSATTSFAHAFTQGRSGGVVEDIATHFRSRVDVIEKDICARYPSRAALVHDAFGAHRSKKYNLSVPVLLAQADGMWWDRFGVNFFSRRGRTSFQSTSLSNIQFSVFKVFYGVFEKLAPLWASHSDRPADFDQLNRHQVLHGEVVDYGTEHNSLRAISFLAYLSWVLTAPWE